MTNEPKTYPDTRDGLRQMLLDSDAGFGLYKSYHWDAVMRDVVGPWLDAHDENVRREALAALEPARVEHRAIYPKYLLPDSEMTVHVLNTEDAEEAEGRVSFVNRRLVAHGLPETARVETRTLLATPWPESDPA